MTASVMNTPSKYLNFLLDFLAFVCSPSNHLKFFSNHHKFSSASFCNRGHYFVYLICKSVGIYMGPTRPFVFHALWACLLAPCYSYHRLVKCA